MKRLLGLLFLLAGCRKAVPVVALTATVSGASLAVASPASLTPPAIDFALTPDIDYCSADPANCHPHQPYGAWIGTAQCLPQVKVDFAGVARPNRAPNTLFPGDTGCDIGAYQYVSGSSSPATPPVPANLRLLP